VSKRRIVAAVAAVGVLAIATGCDQVTTAGHNWVMDPDPAFHQDEPLIRLTGQCGDGYHTWITKSAEYNVNEMGPYETIIATCYPGIPVGTWGLEDRAS